MRVLVLTDHGRHTASNSLYALARALAGEERVGEVRVASRATPANAAFFACDAAARELATARVGEDFAFAADGRAFARPEAIPLDWPDAVVLRIPHPVPPGWFAFLPGAFPGRPIVNRPAGIAATTSKAWLLNVAEVCPAMALCAAPTQLASFVGGPTGGGPPRDAVLKPLDGYGGAGILRVRAGRVEVPGGSPVPLDRWPAHPLARRPYLAMEYLARVGEGDKRIVVVGDRVLGAVLRVPAPGAWLCNVAQGGRAEAAGVSFAERRILDVLAPRMAALGVVMYGVDTLVGNAGERVLSEVNTMSIGGLDDLPAVAGRSAATWAAAGILDAVAALLPQPRSPS